MGLLKKLARKRAAKATRAAHPDRVLDSPAEAGQAYLEAEPWIIEELRLEKEPDRLFIKGWAFPPEDGPGNVRFLLNGRDFENVLYPIARPDLESRFWQRRNAAKSGFECSTGIAQPELTDGDFLECEFHYGGAAAERQPGKFASLRTAAYREPDPGLPMPDPARRFRVIGTESLEMFTLGGATDFRKIEALLGEEFGKSYRDFTSILDWGCGCGRVARHFNGVKGVRFTGGDIDPDNIAWCAENLAFGSFHHLPLVPPTGFADDSFDLVYGISVFTHLHEDIQFRWLEELKRITKPGAVILVTIHGVTALNHAGLDERAYAKIFGEIQEKGFLTTSLNDQINDIIEDKEYHINVMHAKWYIREKWTPYFRLVDIVPGCIDTHDMVVLVNE